MSGHLKSVPAGKSSTLERLEPTNIAAEESVLGAVLQRRESADIAFQMLDPNDFYRTAHKVIFGGLHDLYREGKPCDIQLLADELDKRGHLDLVDGKVYLVSLRDTCPNPFNVRHYAEQVLVVSRRRKLIQKGYEMLNEAYDPAGTPEAKIKDLVELRDTRSPERFFDGNTFIPKRLGDELLQMHSIKFTGGVLWIYKDGVYRKYGSTFIGQEAQKLLGEEARDNRITEVLRYIERATYCELPEPDLVYINLKNGRLDWLDKKLEPHSPEDFDICQIPVKYDPEATCPEFDRYLETTFDISQILLVEELLGYCLTPDTRHEKAFMLVGPGSNGKSVFIDVSTSLLGWENVSNIDLQALEESRFAAAGLMGKRANLHADLDDRALASSKMFKTLVTGDRITVEKKYGQPFSFKNHARLIFSANSFPLSPDKSPAFYRRLIFIPFENNFTEGKQDKNLRRKLTTPEELSGILNRALRGLERLTIQDGFSIPDKSIKCLEDYQRRNDSIAAFADEYVEVSATGQTSKQEFYDAYCSWCTPCVPT